MRIALAFAFSSAIFLVPAAHAHSWAMVDTDTTCAEHQVTPGITINPADGHGFSVITDVNFFGDQWCIAISLETNPADPCPQIFLNDFTPNPDPCPA